MQTKDVAVVAAVVILCGSPTFVQEFMFAADDMEMTDPKKYLYLLLMYNAVTIKLPWDHNTKRDKPQNAFRPVLQV